MTHESALWIVVIACALHVVEEALLDWVGVVQKVAPIRITWADFYVVNAAMIVGAVAGAMIGWQQPEFSLIIPALTVINAVIFHIGGTLALRKFSPGLITAVAAYLPAAAWAYYGAYADGVLTAPVIIWSTLGGALVMAFPMALLALKGRIAQG